MGQISTGFIHRVLEELGRSFAHGPVPGHFDPQHAQGLVSTQHTHGGYHRLAGPDQEK